MTKHYEVVLEDPGLVRNTESEMHCLHACLMMALRTGNGVAVPSFAQLDAEMRTNPKFYTWQYAIMRVLANSNFDMRMVELFDTAAFLDDKEKYLISYFGDEVGKNQIDKSDLTVVEDDLRNILRSRPDAFLLAQPTLEDIAAYIKNGWYCLCNINQKILQADEGYVGHMVFVFGVSTRGVRLHNPGPPATRNTEIAWDLFDRAWSFPDNSVRNILAVKYRE